MPCYFLKTFAAVERIRRLILHEAIEVNVLGPKVLQVLHHSAQHFALLVGILIAAIGAFITALIGLSVR